MTMLSGTQLPNLKRNTQENNMGYRQYFYEVDRSIVEGIRKCTTEEDLYNFCKLNHIECTKCEYDGKVEYYFPVYKLGKEI